MVGPRLRGCLPGDGALTGTAPRHDAVTEQPRTLSRSAATHAPPSLQQQTHQNLQNQQQQQQPVLLPPALPYDAYEPPQQQQAQWPSPGWALPPQPVQHTPSMVAASTLGAHRALDTSPLSCHLWRALASTKIAAPDGC